MLKQFLDAQGLTLESELPYDSAEVTDLTVKSMDIEEEYADAETLTGQMVSLENLLITFDQLADKNVGNARLLSVACEGLFKNLGFEYKAVDSLELATHGLVKTGSLDNGYGVLTRESFGETAKNLWTVLMTWWNKLKAMIRDWWNKLWDVAGRMEKKLHDELLRLNKADKGFKDGITLTKHQLETHIGSGWHSVKSGHDLSGHLKEVAMKSHFIFVDYMKDMAEFAEGWLKPGTVSKNLFGRVVIEDIVPQYPRVFGHERKFPSLPYSPSILNRNPNRRDIPVYYIKLENYESTSLADITLTAEDTKVVINATLALLRAVSVYRTDWRAFEQRMDTLMKAAEVEFTKAISEFGSTQRSMTHQWTTFIRKLAELTERVPRAWCSYVMKIAHQCQQLVALILTQATANDTGVPVERTVNSTSTGLTTA